MRNERNSDNKTKNRKTGERVGGVMFTVYPLSPPLSRIMNNIRENILFTGTTYLYEIKVFYITLYTVQL